MILRQIVLVGAVLCLLGMSSPTCTSNHLDEEDKTFQLTTDNIDPLSDENWADSVSSGSLPGHCSADNPDWTVGLISWKSEAFPGYTLLVPPGDKTYLLDMCGRVVHLWEHEIPGAMSVYLLEDGNLLRVTSAGANPVFDSAGGFGGRVEIVDWDSDILWAFELSNDDYMIHHDVEMLPNGNILMIRWEKRSKDEVLERGGDPLRIEDDLLILDSIIEVMPEGKEGGTIVWQWDTWDHLIQDFDPEMESYGNVYDHPERVDINYAPIAGSDWLHTNAVDYNRELDQIIISVRNLNEFWIIDHSTTIEEAASGEGGVYGMGGDLLYRWGNPQAYQLGDEGSRQLFMQHDAHWIEEGLPGSGNVLFFNNNDFDGEMIFSSVSEVILPYLEDGAYFRDEDQPFEPMVPTWTYAAENKEDFYSPFLSSAQRMPNGNTLICSGGEGRIFEVTEEQQMVWEYINPVMSSGIMQQGKEYDMPDNFLFRAYRYAGDFPGLDGKALIPGGYIEQPE